MVQYAFLVAIVVWLCFIAWAVGFYFVTGKHFMGDDDEKDDIPSSDSKNSPE